MYKRIIAVLLTAIVAIMPSMSCFAGWNQIGEKWRYEKDGKVITGAWITENQETYYMDVDGYMQAGWMRLSDTWYFLNTVHDGTYGKSLKGWQWIDGYCYFFQNDGKMLADTVTPDGFQVSESGAWSIEGKAQYIANKGIITDKTDMEMVRSGGGFGGGGGNSGGAGRPGYPNNPDTPDTPEEPDPEVPEKPEAPEEPGEDILPEVVEQYSYTILYKDIDTQEVLHLAAGQGKENETIGMDHLDIEGFELCIGQKDSFQLVSDQMDISIYYRRLSEASPSDAVKVSWNIYFVEKDDHTGEIFKMQSGKSAEGTELVVDFPEIILGKDGYSYQALKESPYSILLYGAGLQKYYIEFEKSVLPEEPDPDEAERGKLNHWLELSRMADKELTGIVSMDGQLVTGTLKESNERLKNLFSMVTDTRRHEVYLIARNHTPSSFTLSLFPDAGSISEMVMDRLQIGDEEYIILKIGFEKRFIVKDCTHSLRISNNVTPGCLSNGSQTVTCTKCGYEVSVIAPAQGHLDADGNGSCEICYIGIVGNEEPEDAYFELGDLQARKIGSKVYLFRCIDEDYEDSLNNTQRTALFLCDQIIRSDIDSTTEVQKTMSFGGNNNYKSSTVRSWLQENAKDSLFATHKSYIGVSLAYTGGTEKGNFDQFDDVGLIGREKPFQLLEDNIFSLSVEEAVKYKEVLWKFNGEEVNNPESQYSAYSKGYWLRTPQYEESNGQFSYGMGAYAVDVVDGNIHTVDVGNESIGVRPAITVRQGIN